MIKPKPRPQPRVRPRSREDPQDYADRCLKIMKAEAMPPFVFLEAHPSSCVHCKQRPGLHITCFNRALQKAKRFVQ